MSKRPYGKVPIDMGVREAARYLGVDPAWLSKVARIPFHDFAPDRARLVNGREVPSWSEALAKKLLRKVTRHGRPGSKHEGGSR